MKSQAQHILRSLFFCATIIFLLFISISLCVSIFFFFFTVRLWTENVFTHCTFRFCTIYIQNKLISYAITLLGVGIYFFLLFFVDFFWFLRFRHFWLLFVHKYVLHSYTYRSVFIQLNKTKFIFVFHSKENRTEFTNMM